MLKAVAIKELREAWWLAGIALVVFAFAVADLMGEPETEAAASARSCASWTVSSLSMRLSSPACS